MNRSIVVAASLALASAPASALNLVTGGVGTSGADFMTVGVGARALAMGSAFTAVDSGADANAVNWNPAALGFVDKPNVTASYNSLFVDQNQGYLGYAAPAARYGAYNGGRLTPSEMRAVNAEGQGKWKEIRWARSPEAAVARARSEDKPLFVFIVVGEHGQQNADHC